MYPPEQHIQSHTACDTIMSVFWLGNGGNRDDHTDRT